MQEPFSFLAAKQLTVTQFVFLTQVALLMSIPLLVARGKSRRDLVLLLGNTANYRKLGALFSIGIIGLLLFKLALSNAHPIIISAIINLQPFFAALVALIIARVPIPVSPTVFFGCLISAFLGAMLVAWSQVGEANRPDLSQLAESAMHGTWLYAIPVPICTALGGTLVCKWFAKYDESAAIAANFFVSAVILIPVVGFFLYWRSDLHFGQAVPVILMMAGTIIAASVGRVLYQIALSVTGERQRLRHDVLSPDPGPHRFDIVRPVVVDFRFAFCCQLDVLCRPGCRFDVAPVLFAEILGAVGMTMIKTGSRIKTGTRFGQQHPSPARPPPDGQGLTRLFPHCRDARFPRQVRAKRWCATRSCRSTPICAGGSATRNPTPSRRRSAR